MTHQQDLVLDCCSHLQRVEHTPVTGTGSEIGSGTGPGTVHPRSSDRHGATSTHWSAQRPLHPAQPLVRPAHPLPSTIQPMLRAALGVLRDTRPVWREPLA